MHAPFPTWPGMDHAVPTPGHIACKRCGVTQAPADFHPSDLRGYQRVNRKYSPTHICRRCRRITLRQRRGHQPSPRFAQEAVAS